jgi:hypothetical protein
MVLTVTDPSSGAALTADDLLAISQEDGSCDCYGFQFSAAAILEAMTSNEQISFEEVDLIPGQRDFAYHEVHYEQGVCAVGFLRLPFQGPVPTALEVAVAMCLESGLDANRLSAEISLFFRIGTSIPDPVARVVKRSLWQNSDTFTSRNLASKLEDGPLNDGRERICRHLLQSYDYHMNKYGFLELFRASEACFLLGILQNVNAKFLSHPRRILEEALSSISAENRAVKDLIEASQSNQIAELVADRVNALRAGGNTLATELYDRFERRTEKDKSKTWRAACYLYLVRCSIAHAGQDGLIFEDYVDGEALLSELFPLFEEIVLRLVGISSVAPQP